MRIIVAPDSFKESMKARDVASYISQGIKNVLPDAEVIQVPLSDGGEGLIDALIPACGGSIKHCEVSGPLGEKTGAYIGVLGDHKSAVIEMAQASGLQLLKKADRNPMYTSSFGTGELIKEALDQGCCRLIIGIGGSATNDAGCGMAQALGAGLYDLKGKQINSGAGGLLELSRIDISFLDPRLKQTKIIVACDVQNALYGGQGAAYIYGPQKGADAQMLSQLDQALRNFADVVERDLKIDLHNLPGAGAAGGMGAGLTAFTGAELKPGLQTVFDLIGFPDLLTRDVDLIITGEGQINAQTLAGKVPAGVARLAKKYGIPVLAITGSIGPGAEDLYDEGIVSIMSIAPGPITLEESISRCGELLCDAASRAMRMILMNAGISLW